MAEYVCSYCPFATDDGWAMLFHRDTHRDDPRVVAGMAEVDAILAALPKASDSGPSRGDVQIEDGETFVFCAACNTWLPAEGYEAEPFTLLDEHDAESHESSDSKTGGTGDE